MIPRLFYLCLMANLKLYVFLFLTILGFFFDIGGLIELWEAGASFLHSIQWPPQSGLFMGRGIDIVLSGFSTKRNLVKKGGSPSPSPSMFRFTYLSSAVGGNLLLGHLCQDDDSPPHRHNSCISFSLLLIFLHRHHPKQSRGCKREEISCFFIRSQACLFLGDFCSFRKCN